MVTRFTASEARLKAENAKKTLEDQRKRTVEIKKILAKERAGIKQGFEVLKINVISAAIEGKNEIEVDSIYLFRNFIDSGIQVVETGLVKKQNLKCEKVIDPEISEQIKKEILEKFDKFIDASKQDLKGYYGRFQLFHRLNYDALYEAINSDWSWSEFEGDSIYLEEVPDDLKAKYLIYIEKINKKIQEFKAYNTDSIFDSDTDEDSDTSYEEDFDDQLINGEYCFSEDDDEVDLLKPSIEGNTLKIKWASETGNTYMNDPLLSDVGLAWLSTYRGQNLVEAIFDSLNSAAEMGKTSLKLNFSLDKDGWLFNSDSRKVFSCMPNELVEIISRENFSIDDTSSTQKTYSIKVSW